MKIIKQENKKLKKIPIDSYCSYYKELSWRGDTGTQEAIILLMLKMNEIIDEVKQIKTTYEHKK